MGNKHKSHPIGTERTNSKGYIEVKTSKRYKNGTIVWEGKQRVIWSEAFGEIPIDKKVIFKDGNKTNFELDNLQLVDLNFASENSIKSRFKKGIKVWNKGLHYQPKGRSIETRFKKGNIPPNLKQEGSSRIDKDGYTWIKINGKYKLKHRTIYQEHHKVILHSKEYVSFKDGNKQNFAIENLVLKSQADMMEHNTIHQYPPELQDVIRVLGKVKKTIKKKEKNK